MLRCVSCRVRFFFFKQKTAYELRISDWSSDVCSSDLQAVVRQVAVLHREAAADHDEAAIGPRIAERKTGGHRGAVAETARSEERRVGKECVSPCRSRLSRTHYKKITQQVSCK